MASHATRDMVDELFTKLASDSQRLVKIFVGDSEHPVHLQQSVLEGISGYFIGAFAEGRFEEGRSGILRLPEDNIEVWKIIVTWIVNRAVPEDLLRTDLLLAIRCWITGDKYDIKEFQDAVMLCILAELVSDGVKLNIEMIKVSFEETPVDSPLREVIVNRRMSEYDLKGFEEKTKHEEMWILDGTGFLPLLESKNKLGF
ncbi:uncharacterized protein RCC_06414 [Ramularia collo-cygni]|uniref:BTB domain-containing protein n=1 Tax=Ramularia collo-cygni TaxID=112498 RepID=A0A2D3VA80_9PEZI|nr:uncharacterized protein RCC_06414 [Ramularia collo-cygni]CZT20556.1 uncharacterized protein RCC_06414 [Ramularia collo-cygni]